MSRASASESPAAGGAGSDVFALGAAVAVVDDEPLLLVELMSLPSLLSAGFLSHPGSANKIATSANDTVHFRFHFMVSLLYMRDWQTGWRLSASRILASFPADADGGPAATGSMVIFIYSARREWRESPARA